MKNANQFTLEVFDKNPNKNYPEITGYYGLENNNFEILFHIIQTSNEVLWPSPLSEKGTRKDELWKSTCFEIFIARNETTEYREYNFSPNGDWNSYDFSDYRQNMQPADITEAPQIKFDLESNDMHLMSVTLKTDSLPYPNSRPLKIGISAVLKYVDGQHVYYALTHCGSEANFHLRESFVMSI